MRVIYRVLYFVFVFSLNVSMLCHGIFSTSFLNGRLIVQTEKEGVYRVSSNRSRPVSNSQKKMQSLSGLSSTVSNSNTLNEHNLRCLESERRLDSEGQSSKVRKWLDRQQKYSLGQEQFSRRPAIQKVGLLCLADIENENKFYREYCAGLVGNRDSTLKSMEYSFHDVTSSYAITSSTNTSNQSASIASADMDWVNDQDVISLTHKGEIIKRVKVTLGFVPSVTKALVMTLEKCKNGQCYCIDGKCCFKKSAKERNEGLENANPERITKARRESFLKAIRTGYIKEGKIDRILTIDP